MNKEKKEIKEIINEIDMIMFGEKYKDNVFEAVAAGGLVGGMCGAGVGVMYENETIIITTLIGILAGMSSLYLIDRQAKSNIYKSYERAYLNLKREEQLEVLRLSKRLVKLYEKEIKGKKSIKKYLQISDKGTMFDEFESNHPQLKLLTEEEIENIHQNGKLTSVEKFNEWRKLNFCPASIDLNYRCENYNTCRDCTVDWANEKKEWDKMETIPVEMVYNLEDDYEQLWFKKNKEIAKRKTRNA